MNMACAQNYNGERLHTPSCIKIRKPCVRLHLQDHLGSKPQKKAGLFSLNRFYTGKNAHFLPKENDCSLD
jgi:hypothetical protein